jgi:hypothetical protein
MDRDHTCDFSCLRCQARYRIVRIRSEPSVTYRMLQCMVCDQSLAPTENGYILKYFRDCAERAGRRALLFPGMQKAALRARDSWQPDLSPPSVQETQQNWGSKSGPQKPKGSGRRSEPLAAESEH